MVTLGEVGALPGVADIVRLLPTGDVPAAPGSAVTADPRTVELSAGGKEPQDATGLARVKVPDAPATP